MSLWAIWSLSSVASSLLDYGEDVGFAEDEQIVSVNLHLGAAVLGVEDRVALRYVERDALRAILVPAAVTYGKDLALLGLLLGGVGQDDPACCGLLLIERLDDQPVAERLEIHYAWTSIESLLAYCAWHSSKESANATSKALIDRGSNPLWKHCVGKIQQTL